MRRVAPAAVTFLVIFVLAGLTWAQPTEMDQYRIYLKAREFTPEPQSRDALGSNLTRLRGQHVLIQFDHIPSTLEKQGLENAGIRLSVYIPNYAWFAMLTAETLAGISGVRFISAIEAVDKISTHLVENGIAPRGMVSGSHGRVNVIFFDDATQAGIQSVLNDYGGGENVFADVWEVTLEASRLLEFAANDKVQWVEDIPPEKTTYLDILRYKIKANQVQTAPYNLHGSGYTAAMWDAGSADSHTDYSSRLTIGDGSPNHYHPTLVAGAIVGNGSRSAACGGSAYQWRGIATQAELISYDWTNPIGEHNSAINTYNADVSNNSWGWDKCQSGYCTEFGDYDTYSRSYDQIVRGLYGGKITIVGAAGNDGECTICSSYLPDFPFGTLAGPISTSKNAITVSGTHANNDGWWSTSSRGPTDDGRTKPDVAAPACKTYDGIKTTYTDNCYNADFCGTSFSAPAVSGCALLIYEQYNVLYSQDPLPSTVKALFCQTAQDLGNIGPDFMYGYGRIDIQAAIDLVIEDGGLNQRIVQDQISSSQTDEYSMLVEAGQSELTLTLAWDDKEASAGSGIKLLNNLNLTLISPSQTTYYPWVLDWNNPTVPATTGVDARNNVEQVSVQDPEPGIWTARVTGATVPYSPQNYSLIGPFGPGGYGYLPGDLNMYVGTWPPAVVGSDITYLVNYLRGLSSSAPCLLGGFWASADPNGDCSVLGSDVTRLVSYFTGGAEPSWCPDNQPLWETPADLPAQAPAGWPGCENPVVGRTVIPTHSKK